MGEAEKVSDGEEVGEDDKDDGGEGGVDLLVTEPQPSHLSAFH